MNVMSASEQPAEPVIGTGLAEWARTQADNAPEASAELRLRIAQVFARATDVTVRRAS